MTKVKELKARRDPMTATLYQLYYADGGELPKELSGRYTSTSEALTAAEFYLEKREKVRPRNKSEAL